MKRRVPVGRYIGSRQRMRVSPAANARCMAWKQARPTRCIRPWLGCFRRSTIGQTRWCGDAAPARLDTLHAGRQRAVPYSHLLIATGATDRVLPFPGWTLPGVYTLGAAQIALKSQGCAIGRRVVFAGTGPLLYLVAYQYAKAGAQVEAVLDTNPFAPVRRDAAFVAAAVDLCEGSLLRWLAGGAWRSYRAWRDACAARRAIKPCRP